MNSENTVSIIPDKYKVMSGSALKMIALISMLIDHTGRTIVANYEIVLLKIGSSSFMLSTLMCSYIGRLAFPIYCFLLAEGFTHTKNKKAYGRNLLIFALISEIPWNLIHSGKILYSSQNVFFTLFLGFLGMYVIDKYKDNLKKCTILLIGLLLVSIFLKADYGIRGFAFILLMYVLQNHRLFQAIIGAGFFSWNAGVAFIPISLYNGKRGFIKGKFKYVFYLIYPLHMLVLWFIKLKTVGY